MTLLALDAGCTSVAAAEQLLHDLEELLGAQAVLATTHFAGGHVVVVGEWHGARPYAAVRERWPEANVLTDGSDSTLGAVAAQHTARTSGRLARFRGRAAIERRTTVREVLVQSVVDEVAALGGVPLASETTLDLTEWARPVWHDGRAVLTVQHTSAGLVPFESRHQRPCCAAH